MPAIRILDVQDNLIAVLHEAVGHRRAGDDGQVQHEPQPRDQSREDAPTRGA